jgi:transcription elongation GreA/GreB family factor
MRKEELLQAIVAALETDLAVVFAAAKSAHAAATHEECIADNKYDTLGLEASYVAQGQANRAQELRLALESYRGLALQRFTATSPVRLTALITLEDADGGERRVFLGPEAGGLKIATPQGEILVITPASPLGRELLGKRCDESISIEIAGGEREYTITDLL